MIFHNHLRFALLSAFLSAGTFLLLHGQRAASADDLAEGERLYQIHCAGCHGSKGEGGRGTVLAAPSLSRASTEVALINVIARGIPGTEMLGARLEWQQVRQVAAWVRKLGQQPPQQISGVARRGEQLYLSKGDCASCHAIRTQGGVSGPDLTEIGLRRGSEYLRKALLEPEADVPENFSQYRWHTVIPDNTGGHLMQHGMVDLAIVGADRVTANGDVCNKIGTYLKALAAKDNGVPFYVGLPSPTIDFSVADGLTEIPIEQRGAEEVATVTGRTHAGQLETVRIVPDGSAVANYGFDVTPARLVTGLITERGVISATREELAHLRTPESRCLGEA